MYNFKDEFKTNIDFVDEQHKRQHKLFVDKLESIDLNDVDNKQNEYIKDLLSFINTWLIEHIYQTDKLIPNNH